MCRRIGPVLRAATVLLATMLTHCTASAATLPLRGWFRPDHFMPVRLGPGETSLSGEGIVPVDAAPLPHERVVPVLVSDAHPALRCGTTSIPLRVVGTNERIVASTGDANDAGRRLFPGAVIDPVPLDPADPLTGPPAAWTALHALVLDATSMRRIDDATRSTLLANGVVLATAGPVPPDLSWPWHREAGLWTLRHGVAGPVTLVDSGVYTAMAAWTPRPSATVRKQVVLAGVLVVLAAAAAVLLPPPRWRLAGVALVAVVASAAALRWRAVRGSLDQAGGDVFVSAGDGLVQRDVWLYQRARDRTRVTLPWAGDTEPVFDTPTSLEQTDLHLRIDPAGALWFSYTLPAGSTLALRRRVLAQGTVDPLSPGERASPLRDLADKSYVGPGLRVEGELRAAAGRWNGVLVGQ